MTLSAGTRLGPYEITGALGAGGMGEVYRARDTNLNRSVAIKVVLPDVVNDPDRLARFRREAQVLASLNHPNIAHIHGLEESSGVRALVMELVEGPTLADRIAQGRVPVEETLAIARQIADALEAAHENGIIHRDLKPANIKINRDDVVKILDFGLAKPEETVVEAASGSNSQSPTLSHNMTQAGMILGTAAYMSPEQARGKKVDKRADIWAFGVVLFEMITGKRLFEGETVSDSLAAVLMREPDWSALPSTAPASIRRLLESCLERDPKKRLRDIGDARLMLGDVSEAQASAGTMSAPRAWQRALPWAVAAAAIFIAGWMALRHTGNDPAALGVMHLDVNYPADVEPVSGLQGGFALSPDGSTVAMIGVRGGVRRLYIRRLDRPEAVEINDTAGVNSAFFSPDSGSVAYIPGSASVTRLTLANQERATVASGADLAASIAWSSTEVIFNKDGALWAAPLQGGSPRRLTELDAARHEVLHSDPLILPGEHAVLFTCITSELGTERIEAVSMDGKRRWVVVEHAVTPLWSPTGHLLFGREGAVWAVPFDPDRATTHGDALPVIPPGIVGSIRTGGLGYQLSSTGTLVFVPLDFDSKRVISVGRDGSELALTLPPNRYGNPRVSPDGRRLLVESEATVIETLDLVRGTRARLTAAAGGTSFATWTADGQGVVFRRFNVPFWVAADGSGKAGPLSTGIINDYPASPGPDPDSFLDVRIQAQTSGDIYLLSISGKFPPKPLIVSPAYEGGPQLSPDTHWLLYQSNESGQPEIYLRRYPALDRHWQVSEGGGVQARWSTTGKEIYYRHGEHMMAAAFDGSRAEPAFGRPVTLFADEYDFGQGISIPNYDVTRDGRFVMLRRVAHGSSLHVVIHWTEELKRILASGGAR